MRATGGVWWLTICVAVAGLAAPARAAVEFGVTGGFVAVDEDVAGPGHRALEPTLGLRGGFDLFPRWRLFGDALLTDFTSDTPRGDVSGLSVRGGVELLLWPGAANPWFVNGGAGYMNLDFSNADTFSSGFASLGVGQHVPLGRGTFIRWELRIDQSLADNGLVNGSQARGQDVTTAQFLIGVSWSRGGAYGPRVDRDGDGVADRDDRCHGTPGGAVVDRTGCPLDGDGDGVPDGIDRCAGTAPGAQVDPAGCPEDADGDGVSDRDGVDRCPNTPAGARVDAWGCPLDGDGDGVPDGIDRCPQTLAGIQVDASGCFLDADGDGVYDGLGMDLCPGTPPGTPVDSHGCPVDGSRN